MLQALAICKDPIDGVFHFSGFENPLPQQINKSFVTGFLNNTNEEKVCSVRVQESCACVSKRWQMLSLRQKVLQRPHSRGCN